jgi:hypothetical protein
MLVYQEVPISEIQTGDLVEVEMKDAHVGAKVVGCNLELGEITIVPYSYAARFGSGFVIGHRPPAMKSGVLTIRPGESGLKVLKAVDSEAAVVEPLTWERIAELEPGVVMLHDEIRTEHPHEGNYLAIWRKYKLRLSALVGWERVAATHPELRSSRAYNIVYDTLLNRLSDPE